MLAAPVVRMGRTEDVGLRIGLNFTVIALGAVAGPPISGAINAATGGFKFTGIYAGTRPDPLRVLLSPVIHKSHARRIRRCDCGNRLDFHASLHPWQAVGEVLDAFNIDNYHAKHNIHADTSTI